ncbi:MAG: hypothetical protein M0Z39_01840 [Actinomycetota bacterium]|jgi:hypothetical protein|nr:hypothetical protein [Actinomycetota bacterium]
MTQAIGVGALRDLSKARRHHFVEKVDLINAIYKAYLVGAALLVGSSLLVGLVQAAPLGSAAQRELVRYGPSYAGLALGLVIFAGLRSGSRGGPLAIQGADVRMILLSGVPRSHFLRSKAISQVRSTVAPALLVGGIVGGIAHRALGAGTFRLVVEGALVGLVGILAFFGSGYIASGLRVKKWLALAVGAIVVIWAAVDVFHQSSFFPGTWLGQLFFSQEHLPYAMATLGIGLAMLAVGISVISGLSLEMLEYRARLVGTLRFAATMRDIRTVILLRRQLSGEKARAGRSWLSGMSLGRGETAVVSKRSLESLYRWPLARVGRFVVLAVAAGLAARLMWSGSLFPLAVAIIALYVGATDLLEPLSQLADHPDAVSGIGVPMAGVESRLLLVPLVGMVIFVLIGTLATSIFSGFGVALHVGLISAIPLAASATTGAAVSILRRQKSSNMPALMPEVVAITSVIVEILPFIIVASGFVAMVNAYNLHVLNTSLIDTTAVSAGSFSLVFPLAAWTWIRRRNEFLQKSG